jgi:hypothetical protein
LKKDRQHNVIERFEDIKEWSKVVHWRRTDNIPLWYLLAFLLHCVVCPSSMEDFWLPLGIFKSFYYIVLSVLLQWTTVDYPLVSSNLSITLYCLSFFNGRLLITPWYLQIFLLHCIGCPSSMDDFWLLNRKIWRYQGVIKSRPLKKDRQHNVIERFEDIKE